MRSENERENTVNRNNYCADMDADEELEWYDDRYTLPAREAAPEDECDVDVTCSEIYSCIDRCVWKQTQAKKQASLLMWKTLTGRGSRSNVMFVGPSGCGKTEIWRVLQKNFPDRIVITDCSNVTQTGWVGDKKVETLFENPIFTSGKRTILVMDEIDKMLGPKYSYGNNVSFSIMSEFLKPMDGCQIKIKNGKNDAGYLVDTGLITFVMCGAFSLKTDEIAEKNKKGNIGFYSDTKEDEQFSTNLTADDILSFGASPEFLGRVSNIVNLDPMTQTDYFEMIRALPDGPVQELEREYGIGIELSDEKLMSLSAHAAESRFGVRDLKNQLRNMVEDMLFDNPEKTCFVF